MFRVRLDRLETACGYSPRSNPLNPLPVHLHLMLHRIAIHNVSERLAVYCDSLDGVFPASAFTADFRSQDD
jgi:hypothetical protein